MEKLITVTDRGDLIKSKKSNRTYFVIKTSDNEKFVCYNPSMYPDYPIGAEYNISYKEKEGTDNELLGIAGQELEPDDPKPSPAQVASSNKAKSYDQGQEQGMCVKEIGELIRTEKLSFVYGKENAINILKWYRGYLSSTLKFPCDGAKLPTFEVKKGD